jgi:hypothetical protein
VEDVLEAVEADGRATLDGAEQRHRREEHGTND